MKKILITSWAMEIGGVERSLIGLLNAIDYSKYDVDLFLCRHEGEFLSNINSDVNLLPEIKKYKTVENSIMNALKDKNYSVFFRRCKGKFFGIIRKIPGVSMLAQNAKVCIPALPVISNENYDLAISFLTPHYFTDQKVKAKKKIAWIHTDYSAIDIDVNLELEMWSRYQSIAGISESSVQAFNKVFPSLKDKTMVIENIMSSKFVNEQANMIDVSSEVSTDKETIKICTVGRFCEAKAYDNCIKICRKLIDKGLKIKWYAIGYGGDEPMMRELIKENNLENDFIILGKKDNPYPYMKACDVYAQLSRYEGKSVAVTEAKMLCKPVIITNFPTAVNHLDNGVDGFIVPMEIEKCTEEIAEILKDKVKQQEIINYLKNQDYSNLNEVEKIYKLID